MYAENCSQKKRQNQLNDPAFRLYYMCDCNFTTFSSHQPVNTFLWNTNLKNYKTFQAITSITA